MTRQVYCTVDRSASINLNVTTIKTNDGNVYRPSLTIKNGLSRYTIPYSGCGYGFVHLKDAIECGLRDLMPIALRERFWC